MSIEDLEAGVDVPRGHVGLLEVPLDHRVQERVLGARLVDGAAAARLADDLPFDDPLAHAVDPLDVEDLVLVCAGALFVHRSSTSVRWESASRTASALGASEAVVGASEVTVIGHSSYGTETLRGGSRHTP